MIVVLVGMVSVPPEPSVMVFCAVVFAALKAALLKVMLIAPLGALRAAAAASASRSEQLVDAGSCWQGSWMEHRWRRPLPWSPQSRESPRSWR